jgi:hypothetical protein
MHAVGKQFQCEPGFSILGQCRPGPGSKFELYGSAKLPCLLQATLQYFRGLICETLIGTSYRYLNAATKFNEGKKT